MISSHVLNQAGGRALRSPAHFEKLLRGCLVGLGSTSSSLIHRIGRYIGVRKVLLESDICLFFTMKGDLFRLKKLQCLPVSFRQSNLSYRDRLWRS